MLTWKLGFHVNDAHGIVNHLIWAQIKGIIGKLVDRKNCVYLIHWENFFFILFNQRLKCVFIFMQKIESLIHIVHFEWKAWINYCHIFQHIYWDFSFFIPFSYFGFSLYALCCFFFLSHDMFYALFFCFLYYKFYGYVCNKTQVYYNIFKIIFTLLNMLKFSL